MTGFWQLVWSERLALTNATAAHLDLVLEGNGVTVVLVGNTTIKNGITTSTFASIPDVPVSIFALDLPTGANPVLTSSGTLFLKPLPLPPTFPPPDWQRLDQEYNYILEAGDDARVRAYPARHATLVARTGAMTLFRVASPH